VSFRRLVTALTFIAVLTMAARVAVDSDTFWHLRAGAWMVEHGQVLRTDPFSLTRAGQAWIYPGWLAEIVLYGIYSAWGFTGLDLFTALLALASFALIWHTIKCPILLRAFLLITAAAASGVYWSARPQMFTLLFTAFSLLVLEKAREGWRRLLWVLVPVAAVWSNLHGGFAVLFILLGIYGFAELLSSGWVALERRTSIRLALPNMASSISLHAVVGLVSLAAIGLNPNGVQMLAYPFRTVSIGVLRQYIQEWQSPNFHDPGMQPFLVLLLLTIAVYAAGRRRPRITDVLLTVVFGAMALLAARNIGLFALAVLPGLVPQTESALSPLLERLPPSRPIRPALARTINVLLLLLVCIAAILQISLSVSPQSNEKQLSQDFPVAAAKAILEQHPPGPLFNSYNWGGYVLWALYPDYPSFVDGRTDLFDDDLLQSYLAAWKAESEWQSVISRWGIRLVLIEPDAPLAGALLRDGWQTRYADSQAVVLTAPPR
jgi:hypothetical protein